MGEGVIQYITGLTSKYSLAKCKFIATEQFFLLSGHIRAKRKSSLNQPIRILAKDRPSWSDITRELVGEEEPG